MKKRLNFSVIVLTAMLTFGALAVTKVAFYKKHYQHQYEHCEKAPAHVEQASEPVY